MTSTLIVTGASSGIGKAVALKFHAEGWNVGLIARSADALAEMAQGHAGMLPLACDVTDEVGVNRAFDAAAAQFGRIDALFNNAGMFGKQAPIDEISLADWRQVIDVNVTGMFLCARAAFARMRAQRPQGGRIINNGSISAHTPRSGSVCYTASKHAVTGLTKTISLDGRDLDIACGQIDIGNARTDMVDALNARMLAADPDAKPNPVMEVADVANAVFLMATLPLSANVLSMTIMANKMAFVGRG